MPNIAIVYDHLATPYGGAEKVLQALYQAFPEAPLYTSVYNKDTAQWAKVFNIKTTFLQHIPFLNTHHRLATIGMPLAFEMLQLDAYDVIISVSSSCAKGVVTKPHQLHICYLLTPTRFLFSHQEEYLESYSFLSIPGIKQLTTLVSKYLKWWDSIAIHRPDLVVSISNLISHRTKIFYDVDSNDVIYPPATTPPSTIEPSYVQKKYFFSLSRLVPYKRVDLCIESCLELQQPLIIAGDGPDKKYLTQIHPFTFVREHNEHLESFLLSCFSQHHAPVCFVGSVTESEKWRLLAHAQGLLMPGEEDFGITALEAASVGITSVIHKNSGVAEILDQRYALHLEDATLESVKNACILLQKNTTDSEKLVRYTKKYDTKTFITTFQQYVAKQWQTYIEVN